MLHLPTFYAASFSAIFAAPRCHAREARYPRWLITEIRSSKRAFGGEFTIWLLSRDFAIQLIFVDNLYAISAQQFR